LSGKCWTLASDKHSMSEHAKQRPMTTAGMRRVVAQSDYSRVLRQLEEEIHHVQSSKRPPKPAVPRGRMKPVEKEPSEDSRERQ